MKKAALILCVLMLIQLETLATVRYGVGDFDPSTQNRRGSTGVVLENNILGGSPTDTGSGTPPGDYGIGGNLNAHMDKVKDDSVYAKAPTAAGCPANSVKAKRCPREAQSKPARKATAKAQGNPLLWVQRAIAPKPEVPSTNIYENATAFNQKEPIAMGAGSAQIKDSRRPQSQRKANAKAQGNPLRWAQRTTAPKPEVPDLNIGENATAHKDSGPGPVAMGAGSSQDNGSRRQWSQRKTTASGCGSRGKRSVMLNAGEANTGNMKYANIDVNGCNPGA